MPKSGQKRQSEPSKVGNVSSFASDHNYDTGINCNLQEGYEEEFPPLPLTPSKPPIAKKPTISSVHTDSDAVRTLANLINTRSDAIEKMVEAVSK